MNRATSLLAALVTTLALAACSSSGSDGPKGEGGPRATDARLLAGVVVDHVDGVTSASGLHGSSLDGDEVGASLELEPASVQVRSRQDDPKFADECDGIYDGCERLDDDGDREVWLVWQDEEPEEDPGAYTVWTKRGGQWLSIAAFGPAVTADPRELDLPDAITVDTLRAALVDPDLGLDNARTARLAEAVPGWSDEG